MTHLEEDPHHCKAIRLAGCLSKAGVLSVPVHQVKLAGKEAHFKTQATESVSSYPKYTVTCAITWIFYK